MKWKFTLVSMNIVFCPKNYLSEININSPNTAIFYAICNLCKRMVTEPKDIWRNGVEMVHSICLEPISPKGERLTCNWINEQHLLAQFCLSDLQSKIEYISPFTSVCLQTIFLAVHKYNPQPYCRPISLFSFNLYL